MMTPDDGNGVVPIKAFDDMGFIANHDGQPSAAVARLGQVKAAIERAARDVNRSPDDVALMVVTKNFPKTAIRPLLAAGHRLFGENRVQEAMVKWPELKKQFPDVKLHFIGHLQSNKVRDIAKLFDVIQSVDRDKVAQLISAETSSYLVKPDLYVQVNSGDEHQKSGVSLDEAKDFVKRCQQKYHLNIQGLMTIPPVDQPSSPYFALLQCLGQECGLPGLSMGMSHDYIEAITLGATMVRVGTAVLGARPPR